jgi:hypothetical protein
MGPVFPEALFRICAPQQFGFQRYVNEVAGGTPLVPATFTLCRLDDVEVRDVHFDFLADA